MPVATVSPTTGLLLSSWFDAVRDSLNNVWKPSQTLLHGVGAGQTYAGSGAGIPTVTTTFTPVVTGSRMWVYFELGLAASAANSPIAIDINYNSGSIGLFRFGGQITGTTYHGWVNASSGTVDVAKNLHLRWGSPSGATLTLRNGYGFRLYAVEY